ncbi:MAG TPA: cation transporter, partial [Lachnospiraceae bacterium]|nr:cation transporter [Lachnospiraceae bacterium]
MEQEITVQKTKESSQTALCIMAGNLLISAVFLASGLLGKSIAAVSEGIDSLTDAVSSLLLLLGFKIASREPDSLHP